MAWFILSQIFSTFLTLLRLGLTSDKDKDLEILAWFKTSGQVRLSHTGYMGHIRQNSQTVPYIGVCAEAIFA